MNKKQRVMAEYLSAEDIMIIVKAHKDEETQTDLVLEEFDYLYVLAERKKDIEKEINEKLEFLINEASIDIKITF